MGSNRSWCYLKWRNLTGLWWIILDGGLNTENPSSRLFILDASTKTLCGWRVSSVELKLYIQCVYVRVPSLVACLCGAVWEGLAQS